MLANFIPQSGNKNTVTAASKHHCDLTMSEHKVLLFTVAHFDLNGKFILLYFLDACFQCCGSGSALILVVWIRIQKGKKTPLKKGKKFHILKYWIFSFEGFSRGLDVHHGDLGINLLKFMI
jgi:hypothetical protein